MIWRLLGYMTIVYLLIGGLLIAFLVPTVGFVSPGEVDWSHVPGHAVVPLWITKTIYWFPVLLLFTALAPFGFFCRASGRPAPLILLTYAIGTLAVLAMLVASPLYLLFAGAVSTSEHSWVIFTIGDVIGSVVLSIPLAFPAGAALLAALLPANQRLPLTDEARDGD